MSAKVGTHLGPYEIVSRAGAGGMGEVRKARDTRLGRTVAIKISDQKFSDRFDCEAHAVAALNHPHISALYDIGPDYLVMEYVEGEPLNGPLPLAKALEYAKQILDALHAAHRAGIVHRDLKPANILVAKSGVKVLDFGLAKRTKAASSLDGLTALGTRSLSGEGNIVGTLHYMAPEQLQGKHVDARADIFAFGCVLYEMITGKRAFDGGSPASVIAAVVERPAPSISNIAPESLDRILRRCLAKDPEERWESALDVKASLECVAMEPPKFPTPRFRWLPWVLACFAPIALAVVAVYFRKPTPESSPVRFRIYAPESASFASVYGPNGSPPAFSPDGRRIAFAAVDASGTRRLWVRSLDAFQPYPLSGTDGAIDPFWSSDGKSIGFFAGGKLKRIDASGGSLLTLADAGNGRGGTWNQNGVIVFAPNARAGLERISASGSSPVSVTSAQPAESHRWPWFLPDGKHFVYIDTILGTGRGTLRLGSLETHESRVLADAESNAIWSGGHLLFMKSGMLVAQPFDLKHLSLTGEPITIGEGIRSDTVGMVGAFSASATGQLLYEGGFDDLRLTWLDRRGKLLGTVGDSAQFTSIQLSRDQRKAVVTERSTGRGRIWIYDMVRGLRSRFTLDDSIENYPVLSADGSTIVFSSNRNGGVDLYQRSVENPGRSELIYADKSVKEPLSLTPDNKYLLYSVMSDPRTGSDLWLLQDPLGPPGKAKAMPFAQTRFNEIRGCFSPDGRWIAYTSDESGQFEVYVVPFRGPGARQQVSVGGGFQSRWRGGGKEIFYVSLNNQLMVATFRAGAHNSLEVGTPEPLFSLNGDASSGMFDVSADGQRVLIVAPQQRQRGESISVVQNWTAGLKR